MGPHPKGSPVIAKEKRCILNSYQSYVDEGKSEKYAKDETARRLGFGFDTVKNAIKEMLAMGYVTDNKASRVTPNAYEKLDDEEIDFSSIYEYSVSVKIASTPLAVKNTLIADDTFSKL